MNEYLPHLLGCNVGEVNLFFLHMIYPTVEFPPKCVLINTFLHGINCVAKRLLITQCSHNRHPIPHPQGRDVRCNLCILLRKLARIYWRGPPLPWYKKIVGRHFPSVCISFSKSLFTFAHSQRYFRWRTVKFVMISYTNEIKSPR